VTDREHPSAAIVALYIAELLLDGDCDNPCDPCAELAEPVLVGYGCCAPDPPDHKP